MPAHKNSRSTRKSITPTRTIVFLMTFSLIFLGVAIFIIRPFSTPSSGVMANAALAEGKVLYDSYCAACHGDQGQAGLVPNVLPLNESGAAWQLSDEELMHIIRNGRNQMPAMGAGLSDQEVAALITYLKHWWTPEQRETQVGDIGE